MGAGVLRRKEDARDEGRETVRPRRETTPSPSLAARAAKAWLSDIRSFSRAVIRRPLRAYQLAPAHAIIGSVLQNQGTTFAVMMSRQAGKNELSAQLEAYLLNLYQRRGGQIVKASPTYKPQTMNSLLRLADRLANPWNARHFRRRAGYMIELGRARALFFSAEPSASVVGATADLLLECDEAQDVLADKWQKDFAPMAASTNATRVFWGTAWTSQTLLARTVAHLLELERQDGLRRVFRVSADEVAAEVPAYATFVAGEVARLGREHPLVRTQYYLQEIDAQGGLFTPLRQALMHGDHPRQRVPTAGARYALLLDVGGEDETGAGAATGAAAAGAAARPLLANPRRDATALTVVEVGGSGSAGSACPAYRVVDRRLWLGTRHSALHEQIAALVAHWHALWVVVDATGVGAGLASFLTQAFGDQRSGGKVLPVAFSARVKSELGWDFVAVVETEALPYVRGQ